MINKEPNYIIAIGASAGGLEEINTFFENTPLDGVAYVIVQHLSPDFKSRMVELLSKHSRLLVKEATHGMAVCTNIVYLIPNDKYMTIKNNRLYLTDKEKIRGPHLTINTFFNSLATDNGKKAIGIILSGLGSDGSEGIKAIKEAGGMTIARNPESTQFSSMPVNAIATDMIDYILEPQFMPNAIEAYVKQNDELSESTKSDEKNITAIIEYINKKSPFDFSDYKMTTIVRRTKRRAASINIYNLKDYLLFLKETPEEVNALSKDFLISVTSFFRDPEAFEFIQNTVLPRILENHSPHDEIKFWIAGCATGEEAYSIAILLKELLTGKFKNTIVKIFATDIDSAALLHAGKGIYAPERVKGISPKRLKQRFTFDGSNYIIKPEIREMMIFAQHDLVKNPPYCNMHFISCRNLLIYMTPILQKKVYEMLLFGLKTNGFLFLGSSENPLVIIENLQIINKKWRVYKSLKEKRSPRIDTFALPELINFRQITTIKNDVSKSSNNTLTETINTTLANQIGYLAICVDQENTVIKSYGHTSKYLLAKNFNTNLPELLPRALAVAYNTLSKEAFKNEESATVKGIFVKHNNAVMKVSLSVNPILIDGDQQKGLIVIFNDDKLASPEKNEHPLFDEVTYNTSYTQALEAELKEVKNKLQATYDKLDTSNENMQSFNEELISANEEMQSTNEEMQSVNEELHTINTDYHLKNKELLEINDDLNNYFRSNLNGQLFIDNDLKLMKFSPGAVKHINLLDTDIGRPINHISTNIKFDTIIEDTRLVLEKGIVISKEIETNNEKWYQVMIMPYVQASNKNNGAIITFNDITELKKMQYELNKKNQSLIRINTDLDHFIHAASHDLLTPLGNIEGSIEMLNDTKISDSSFSEFLYIINSSIKTFRALITDISTIAKVENDMIQTEKVDLNEILDNIEWSLKDKIVESEAKITRELIIKEIHFSKKNIRSILYNLICNSIKFRSEEHPGITIKASQEGNYCVLTISDNGIGISEKGLLKIFDIYGRLHQDIEGSGIGLYLAKKIINAAGGKIVVESELGVGTKFIIYLNQELIEA
ncbi:chemotaxis protein CheB [Flavobacterium sp. N3904]|uniref:chemotaxis protein CheB n=1 Tax=Flavobacterium sp. N3904 TaxID=2986835 RepID=UPI0022259647|nr:chemotaxis protein CheB [Flavobacterium sp. N3904]